MVMDEKLDFEQLLAEAKSKLVRALASKPLTDAELDTILSVFDLSMRTYKTELDLHPPKRSSTLTSITCNGNRVVGWHPVNGVKRQIVQIITDDEIRYYTDGKREIL